MRTPLASTAALGLAMAFLALGAAGAQPAPTASQTASQTWRGCCGLEPWPASAPMRNRSGYSGMLFGGLGGLAGGSTARHNVALRGGIPEPYAQMRNPLPPTPENAQRGAQIYEAHCASCHGATGLADGPRSRRLTPQPAQLGWLNNVPASHWDAFMYWSIAEGGGNFRTSMPAFKDKLSQDRIWSVIGYIQARLPKANAANR
jgi:mono/diheme cytochrome c family protein